jgi:alanyl-tRNA synthetase
MMTSQEIRQKFLDFFKSKEHEIVASAPMVIKNDPTLMFTNAGMNPFKDLFLGNSEVTFPRVADTQKCLRVSGKHNDLEEVGHDTYHHTMFEMLGNWSFGDYFKKEAIDWAWELLTSEYKLEKDRLYVTVFEGSADDGLEFDQEAYDLWKKHIDPSRILKGNKKDNFWEMGDTGPCGPCSEIHIDLRSDEERKKTDGGSLVNHDHPQVIEVWNLVFMEFNRKADGSLEKLPAQHVDTGMGFERLCMALQGKTSNYDTDVFQPLIRRMEYLSEIKYGAHHDSDVAMRVVSDHIRAIAFAIADGQLPSNTGAGYVIRRILRRAVRYGFTFLNLKEPFMYHLIPTLKEQMGATFPELISQEELISKVVHEEEQSFLRTLEQGLKRIHQYIGETEKNLINGEKAFELYDTFGFPIDLTRLIARENGKEVDMESFNKALNAQKDRSRGAGKLEAGDWVQLMDDEKEEFIGYEMLEAQLRITRYRSVKNKGKEQFQLVFNYTPFYPEGGGQVGDTGYIKSSTEKIAITDTKKENNLIIHFADRLPEKPELAFQAVVDSSKRRRTMGNHSATHLLHQALREVLGTHVEQRGSLVNADYLRFDFSHFERVNQEQLDRIEQLVNDRIRANFALDERRRVPMQEALDLGAMALFGEKYGEVVRVIKFGDSVELCGGTHVSATGNIGLFKISSESAIAAGVRRIEALTGEGAEQFVHEQIGLLRSIKELVKNSNDPVRIIQQMQEENARLAKEVEGLNREKAGSLKGSLQESARMVNGVNWIKHSANLDSQVVKDLIFELKKSANTVVAIAAVDGDKVTLSIGISDDLVKEKGLNAGAIIREAAQAIKGGGGGQPFYATAGGKDAGGVEKAFEVVASKL